uniref:Myomesin 3 n=1 Tax=Poecilia reticulata TaxID=8081 RepID=A0A3P9NI63_POERE
TMAADEEYHREKWTRFGNEAERTEKDVIRNQHLLRNRVDKMALRRQSAHMNYLERLSQKAPDFTIPLRAHTVWEGMTVILSCSVRGCPPPKIQIHSCSSISSEQVQKSIHSKYYPFVFLPISLLLLHFYDITLLDLLFLLPLLGLQQQKEAQFDMSFPPTWVKEGSGLSLQCTFTSGLLPFQQDVLWFRDGIQLQQSSNVDIKTFDNKSIITMMAAYKEHEGVYSARLRTRDGTEEHMAFVYLKDGSAAVPGGPASPLAVEVSDVNKDYVFLTWQPPSADGGSPVEGYYVERCDLSQGEWVRCNVDIQKICHFPVFGLREGALHQFRVCAVNKAGVGRPSKATEPVLTADPLEHTRTMGITYGLGRTITITKDELEGQVKAPFPPTDVRACELSDTYVVLSWTEPEPRGREPLTFYVERSLAGKNSWELTSLDTVVNSPRYPVFDLVKDKQYCFRVRSINKYGVSDPSDPSPPISLGKPQAVPPPPHSVMAIRDTDTSVLLQWQEPKGKDDILGYYLYYSEAGKQEWKTVNNKPLNPTRFIVHGLKTWKEYVFRVKSVSRAGNSKYSDESHPILVKSAINVPSPPSAIALLLCTESEMVLGWRAPSSNGGSSVRGYYLDQKEKGMEIWREVNIKPAKEKQLKVSDLKTGHFYQFRVFAANAAGVGKPSDASEAFLCEKWTMPEPGCPYDLELREVRDDSLVLRWASPLYEGQSPVSGYMLEMSQGNQSDNWTILTAKPVSETHYKVTGLQTGHTYCFRVSAVNNAGVGRASLSSEPVTVQTQPGTKEIKIGVDDDGFIFLGYEAVEMNDDSEFIWSKNYTEPIDSQRTKAETTENRSVLTFKDPSEEDLGLYTVEMSDSPQLSSSYEFTAEGTSWTPVTRVLIFIGINYHFFSDILRHCGVRLWLQTESLSNSAELRLVFNDREISTSPRRKINFDKAKGLVEILFDQLSQEDEGSYTAQLRDGRAKNQCTLVFVTNTNKDTSFKWFKDGLEIKDLSYDQTTGIISLSISQVMEKDESRPSLCVRNYIHKLQLTQRSNIIVTHILTAALSAGPLRIESTAEGFKIYSSLRYYISFLKTSWYFKKIDQETRTKPGSSMQKVWMEILNPTENDKGEYMLEMFDGKETHKRLYELSAEDRAKVVKGLPDVVAIMEGKSLCLTCFIDGDPAPEIFWLRNDREILDQTQFTITKESKRTSITVNKVTTEDSGKYSIFVRNQYGSETVDVTLSVYKKGDKPPANAVEMG